MEEVKEAAKTLGLVMFETKKSVNTKYRELIKKTHPDANKGDTDNANRISTEINDAYRIIKDFMENYTYTFDEVSFGKYNPEDKMMQRMKNDTTWGI
jgi:DnaJ-class molecular chaperone